MMEILYQSKPPDYRGSSPQQQASTGMLSGFWGYLFGGGSMPVYRAAGDGTTGSAAPTVARCWWPAFSSAAPYKTAPAPEAAPDDPAPSDPSPDGDPDPDGACPDGVVANEIYLE